MDSESIVLCAVGVRIGSAAKHATSHASDAVHATDSVEDALRTIKAGGASVVVVGPLLGPEIFDACERLRSVDACPDLVIVAVATQSAEGEALLKAGADDFFMEGIAEDGVKDRLLVARRSAASRAERRRLQTDAVRGAAESMATTLDSIGDGVIATDVRGRITLMNPVAAKLSGWAADDARGRRLVDVLQFVDGESRAPVESPVVNALREKVTTGLPAGCLLIRRDGTELPVGDICAPIKARDGTVSGAVLVFRDLTAQRASEAKHARLQEQLILADRMASVGTLAAGVAHEINNPLSYIAANVDMAIEEVRGLAVDTPAQRVKDVEEMLLVAREGVDRVTTIVRGIKSFSRGDEERRRVVDIVPLMELSVGRTVNEIRPRARLVTEYGPIPFVFADSARLGQVFINLLLNASHAVPEGSSGENEVRVITSTDEQGRAVVEIHDTGQGIPTSILGRVFDPFFTTKPQGVGTGLGLTISRTIVTGMGGDITVASEVGRGAVFRVRLPPAGAAEMRVSAAVKSVESSFVRRAVVLVVDDEPSVGLVIQRALRAHDVTVVTSAQAAVDVLATGKEFDVVLSDLMMPGMSGMDLYRAIADRDPKMASRMVFVTGGAYTPEANAFLDTVTNERIEKPFAPQQLRDAVLRFVQ